MVRIAPIRAANVASPNDNNAADDAALEQGETSEAQVSRLKGGYNEALALVARHEAHAAQTQLEALILDAAFKPVTGLDNEHDVPEGQTLASALLQAVLSAPSPWPLKPQLAQLFSLLLRNLASLLPGSQSQASMQLYSATILSHEEQASDATVWAKLAQKAVWADRLGLARFALERVMVLLPRNIPAHENAMEVAWVGGDYQGALDIAQRIVRIDTHHPTARAILHLQYLNQAAHVLQEMSHAAEGSSADPLAQHHAAQERLAVLLDPGAPKPPVTFLPTAVEYPGPLIFTHREADSHPAVAEEEDGGEAVWQLGAAGEQSVLLVPGGRSLVQVLRTLLQLLQGQPPAQQEPQVQEDSWPLTSRVYPGQPVVLCLPHAAAVRQVHVMAQDQRAVDRAAGAGGAVAEGMVDAAPDSPTRHRASVHPVVALPPVAGAAEAGQGTQQGGEGMEAGAGVATQGDAGNAAEHGGSDKENQVAEGGKGDGRGGPSARGATQAGGGEAGLGRRAGAGNAAGRSQPRKRKASDVGPSGAGVAGGQVPPADGEHVRVVRSRLAVAQAGDPAAAPDAQPAATRATKPPGLPALFQELKSRVEAGAPGAALPAEGAVQLASQAGDAAASQAGPSQQGVIKRPSGRGRHARDSSAAQRTATALEVLLHDIPGILWVQGVLPDTAETLPQWPPQQPVAAPATVDDDLTMMTTAPTHTAAAAEDTAAVEQDVAGAAAAAVADADEAMQPETGDPEAPSQLTQSGTQAQAEQQEPGTQAPSQLTQPGTQAPSQLTQPGTQAQGEQQEAGQVQLPPPQVFHMPAHAADTSPVPVRDLCVAVVQQLLSQLDKLSPSAVPQLLQLQEQLGLQPWSTEQQLLLAELHVALAASLSAAPKRTAGAKRQSGRAAAAGQPVAEGAAVPTRPARSKRAARSAAAEEQTESEAPSPAQGKQAPEAAQPPADAAAAPADHAPTGDSSVQHHLSAADRLAGAVYSGLVLSSAENHPLLPGGEGMDVDMGANADVGGGSDAAGEEGLDWQQGHQVESLQLHWVWAHVSELRGDTATALQLYQQCRDILIRMGELEPAITQHTQIGTQHPHAGTQHPLCRLPLCEAASVVRKLRALEVVQLLQGLEASLQAVAGSGLYSEERMQGPHLLSTEVVDKLLPLAFPDVTAARPVAATAAVTAAGGDAGVGMVPPELRDRSLQVLHDCAATCAGDVEAELLLVACGMAQTCHSLTAVTTATNGRTSQAALHTLLQASSSVATVLASLKQHSAAVARACTQTATPANNHADDQAANAPAAAEQGPDAPARARHQGLVATMVMQLHAVLLDYLQAVHAAAPVAPAADAQVATALRTLTTRSHAALLEGAQLLLVLQDTLQSRLTQPAAPEGAQGVVGAQVAASGVDAQGDGWMWAQSTRLYTWSRVLEMLGSRLAHAEVLPVLKQCWADLLSFLGVLHKEVGDAEQAAAVLLSASDDNEPGGGAGSEEEDGGRKAGSQPPATPARGVSQRLGSQPPGGSAQRPRGRRRRASQAPEEVQGSGGEVAVAAGGFQEAQGAPEVEMQEADEVIDGPASQQGQQQEVQPPRNTNEEDASAALAAHVKAVYGAVGQVLFLLTGVRFEEWRDRQFGDVHGSSKLVPAALEINNKEQVLTLWEYLAPLSHVLASLCHDKTVNRLLERLSRFAPPLPTSRLHSSPAWTYLEQPDLNDVWLVLGHARPPAVLLSAVQLEPGDAQEDGALLPPQQEGAGPAAAPPTAAAVAGAADTLLRADAMQVDPPEPAAEAAPSVTAQGTADQPGGPNPQQQQQDDAVEAAVRAEGGKAAAVAGAEAAAMDGVEAAGRDEAEAAVVAVEEEPWTPVHESLHQHLHYLRSQAGDITNVVNTSRPWEDAGHDKIEQVAEVLLSDLTFCPSRLSSWVQLSGLYCTACRFLLGGAAGELTPAEWRSDAHQKLRARLQYYGHRGIRAAAVALAMLADKARQAATEPDTQAPRGQQPECLQAAMVTDATQEERGTQAPEEEQPDEEGEEEDEEAQTLSTLYEDAACVYLGLVQRCTPLGDSLPPCGKPVTNAQWVTHCCAAYILFERALASMGGEEWTFPSVMGKLPRKLQGSWAASLSAVRQGQLPAEPLALAMGTDAARPEAEDADVDWLAAALSRYAQACQLCVQGGAVQVDAWYRLHAARLNVLLDCDKQLQALGPDAPAAAVARVAAVVGVVGRYNAKQSDAAMDADGAQRGVEDLLAQIELLLEDCCAAMQWCASSYREVLHGAQHNHRAHYQLSKVAAHRRQWSKVKEQLQPFFGPPAASSKLKGPFAVQIQKFTTDLMKLAGKKGRRKGRGKGRRTGADAEQEAEEQQGHAAMTLEQCAALPSQAHGVGEDEEERDYWAAIRRMVKLYIIACAATSDLEHLEQLTTFLDKDNNFGPPLFDLAKAARGVHTACTVRRAGEVAQHLQQSPADADQLNAINRENASLYQAAMDLYLQHVVDRLPQGHTLHEAQEKAQRPAVQWLLQTAGVEVPDGLVAASEPALLASAMMHIQALAAAGNVDTLRALFQHIRKKFPKANARPATALPTCIAFVGCQLAQSLVQASCEQSREAVKHLVEAHVQLRKEAIEAAARAAQAAEAQPAQQATSAGAGTTAPAFDIQPEDAGKSAAAQGDTAEQVAATGPPLDVVAQATQGDVEMTDQQPARAEPASQPDSQQAAAAAPAGPTTRSLRSTAHANAAQKQKQPEQGNPAAAAPAAAQQPAVTHVDIKLLEAAVSPLAACAKLQPWQLQAAVRIVAVPQRLKQDLEAPLTTAWTRLVSAVGSQEAAGDAWWAALQQVLQRLQPLTAAQLPGVWTALAGHLHDVANGARTLEQVVLPEPPPVLLRQGAPRQQAALGGVQQQGRTQAAHTGQNIPLRGAAAQPATHAPTPPTATPEQLAARQPVATAMAGAAPATVAAQHQFGRLPPGVVAVGPQHVPRVAAVQLDARGVGAAMRSAASMVSPSCATAAHQAARQRAASRPAAAIAASSTEANTVTASASAGQMVVPGQAAVAPVAQALSPRQLAAQEARAAHGERLARLAVEKNFPDETPERREALVAQWVQKQRLRSPTQVHGGPEAGGHAVTSAPRQAGRVQVAAQQQAGPQLAQQARATQGGPGRVLPFTQAQQGMLADGAVQTVGGQSAQVRAGMPGATGSRVLTPLAGTGAAQSPQGGSASGPHTAGPSPNASGSRVLTRPQPAGVARQASPQGLAQQVGDKRPMPAASQAPGATRRRTKRGLQQQQQAAAGAALPPKSDAAQPTAHQAATPRVNALPGSTRSQKRTAELIAAGAAASGARQGDAAGPSSQQATTVSPGTQPNELLPQPVPMHGRVPLGPSASSQQPTAPQQQQQVTRSNGHAAVVQPRSVDVITLPDSDSEVERAPSSQQQQPLQAQPPQQAVPHWFAGKGMPGVPMAQVAPPVVRRQVVSPPAQQGPVLQAKSTLLLRTPGHNHRMVPTPSAAAAAQSQQPVVQPQTQQPAVQPQAQQATPPQTHQQAPPPTGPSGGVPVVATHEQGPSDTRAQQTQPPLQPAQQPLTGPAAPQVLNTPPSATQQAPAPPQPTGPPRAPLAPALAAFDRPLPFPNFLAKPKAPKPQQHSQQQTSPGCQSDPSSGHG